jgi:rRNA-processing protein FCF1
MKKTAKSGEALTKNQKPKTKNAKRSSLPILIDTNFILTATKQKIDIQEAANQIITEKIEWLIPQDVLNELGNLKDRSGTKTKDRQAAALSFEIMKTLNPKIVELPTKNPNIDIKIVNYILDKPIVLATLDKNLKSRVKNKILTIRGKKTLEII